jgi:hypothetical protein
MRQQRTAAIARWIAAAAILVSGAEHFRLWWFNDYRVIHVIGPLFLLNTVAGLVIAVLLAWRANLLTEVAGLGFAVTTLGAFFVSVYIGLFNFREALYGTSQLIAGISEGVAIVILAPAVVADGLRAWRRLRGHDATPPPPAATADRGTVPHR